MGKLSLSNEVARGRMSSPSGDVTKKALGFRACPPTSLRRKGVALRNASGFALYTRKIKASDRPIIDECTNKTQRLSA